VRWKDIKCSEHSGIPHLTLPCSPSSHFIFNHFFSFAGGGGGVGGGREGQDKEEERRGR